MITQIFFFGVKIIQMKSSELVLPHLYADKRRLRGIFWEKTAVVHEQGKNA